MNVTELLKSKGFTRCSVCGGGSWQKWSDKKRIIRVKPPFARVKKGNVYELIKITELETFLEQTQE